MAVDITPTRPPGSVQPPTAQVESAMQYEFGFTLAELGQGVAELLDLGYDLSSEEPYRLPRTSVERHLHVSLNWSTEKANNFIDRLALAPRDEFLSVGADAYPWRYNREWSYLRRPYVVVLTSDGSEDLVWGPRRTWSSGAYWVQLIYSGRMKARTKQLKAMVSTIRQDENRRFERSVADAFADGGCTIAIPRVGKILGKRLMRDGNDLGDIDAIGIFPDKRVIFVGEAKDFELARIPRELAHEAEQLLNGEKSALHKLSARTRWVKDNLAAVIAHYGIGTDTRGWSVVPIIVTSRDLLSPRVVPSDVPVKSISDVPGFIRASILRVKSVKRARQHGRRR